MLQHWFAGKLHKCCLDYEMWSFFFFAPKQMSILRVKGTNLRFPNRAHHSLHAEAFNAESINSVGTLFFCAVIHSYAGPG